MKPTATELPLVLTVKDVAGVLGIGITTAYNLISSKTIKSFRVRRQIRVSRDALLEFMNGEDRQK